MTQLTNLKFWRENFFTDAWEVVCEAPVKGKAEMSQILQLANPYQHIMLSEKNPAECFVFDASTNVYSDDVVGQLAPCYNS